PRGENAKNAALSRPVPWCSGLAYAPVKDEMAGSNPVGTAGSPAPLNLAKPDAQTFAHRRGADDRLFNPPVRGMKHERVALPSTETAVRSELLLERRDLAGRVVEHADQDEIAAVRHRVAAAKTFQHVRSARGDRVG